MDENLDVIESYFSNQLTDGDKKAFEARCVEDESFSREVAFYITSRELLREELLKKKMNEWRSVSGKMPIKKTPANTVLPVWAPYAAAASIILIIAGYFLLRQPTARELADDYIQKNLSSLSITMGNSGDSLQQALNAYNTKRFNDAQSIFTALYENDTLNRVALKYSGITYLATKDYDKAIERFNELAGKTGLYANPGTFYEAVALMARSQNDDRARAKELLQKVISGQLDGAEDAKWLIKKL